MHGYYHVTTPSAWKQIQKEGLLPQIGIRSQKVHEVIPAVFLFDSLGALKDAYFGWMEAEFNDVEMIILSVRPPKGTFLDEGISCDGEVRCYEAIPPECISYVGSDDDVID